jgi:uncharacterized membrane protein YbhN (UPF0104 family)
MPRAAPPPAGRLPVKRLLLVLGLAATAYAAALLFWGGSTKISFAVLWSWTGLQAASLCVLNYLLRGLRWRFWMAHYGRRFGAIEGLRFYLAGYAFTPTPGNIGEAARGLMLARQPLGTAQSLAIFGAERLADLICLLLLCMPVAGWLLQQRYVREMLRAAPLAVVFLVLAAALGFALVFGIFYRYRAALLRRLPWLGEAARCLAVRPLVWFGLTLVAWAAQGVAVWLLCRHAGLDLPLLTATGVYALAMVVGALSALPAGLGGTEAVLAGLLVAQGSATATALAITVLARLLTLWLAVGLGCMALFYGLAIRKDLKL